MLMQHRLSGACFLFHWDVRLPRKDPLCLERKIPLRSKVFLEWRLFFSIYWWLSSGTYCLQSFWEHWYPIAWTHGQFPYSPSRIIYPFGLLSFYTRLYWLTRGQRQYKITLRNKSWIRFLIGFRKAKESSYNISFRYFFCISIFSTVMGHYYYTI